MWSAAEPCRTRTLSLEMQEPPHQRGMGWGALDTGVSVSKQVHVEWL